jgi:carbonic anhydrase
LATEKPTLDIPEQNSKFLNLNTTIEVEVNGTTTFGGNQFRLAQYHIHTPSEHRISGEYHPLEVHMVHSGVGKSHSHATNLRSETHHASRIDPPQPVTHATHA